MSKITSISLGKYYENFIEQSLNTGRFNNVSEVIRAGLRLLEEEEKKAEILKNAIEEGMNSGYVENFDADVHLKKLKKSKKLNG